jgi:Ceramidase
VIDYIDIYCERLAPGLWAEPLNAVTNAAFFIAAFFAWALLKDKKDRGALLLIVLMLCIGTGSALFHTFATRTTQLMDVIPILLFQISFLWLYSLNIIKLSAAKTFALFAVFTIASVLCEAIPEHVLNGSAGYIPALVFVTGFGICHYRYAAQEKLVLLLAAGLFVISLTFRSIDMAVCQSLPVGTHFLWHSLNGAVLYCCARGYIRARAN